jgi:hypothetical protein
VAQKHLRKEGGITLTEDAREQQQQQKQDFVSIIPSFTKFNVGRPVIKYTF